MKIFLALALTLAIAAPASAADPVAGKQVAGMCAVCHGINGLAKVPDAPHLAGESAQYLTKQLKAFQTGERKHDQMEIIAKGLTDDDMANVAAWYSGLKVTVEMPQ